LKGYDAVIATGGDTAAVHFEYYFRDYPHIIRKNRSSIAILDGTESPEELQSLGNDIFDYFGLGCRSVSKVYLPRGYELNKLFESLYSFKDVIHHNKYKNNYDYNNATMILTNQEFLTNDFLILKEDESLGSRIATLHYEFYDDREQLIESLYSRKDELQCISARDIIDNDLYVPLGSYSMTKQEKADDIAQMLEGFYPEIPIPLDHKDPYTLLVAVLLSAQCTDKRVNEVTPYLWELADNPHDMSQQAVADIKAIIRPCGLSPRKSQAIYDLSHIILEEHEWIRISIGWLIDGALALARTLRKPKKT